MSDGNWVPAKLDGSPGVMVVEPHAYGCYQSDFGVAKPLVAFRGATIAVNRQPHRPIPRASILIGTWSLRANRKTFARRRFSNDWSEFLGRVLSWSMLAILM